MLSIFDLLREPSLLVLLSDQSQVFIALLYVFSLLLWNEMGCRVDKKLTTQTALKILIKQTQYLIVVFSFFFLTCIY